MMPGAEKIREIKPILGRVPRFFEFLHQLLFQCGGPLRTIAAASWFNTASDVGAYMAATESRATCSNLKYVLGP
jgi:hypothetical protein